MAKRKEKFPWTTADTDAKDNMSIPILCNDLCN